MTTSDEGMPRRRFLSGAAVASIGAAIVALAPSLARGRAGATPAVAASTGIEHVVNGSFEDGPTGSTIPGWTATRPSI